MTGRERTFRQEWMKRLRREHELMNLSRSRYLKKKRQARRAFAREMIAETPPSRQAIWDAFPS